MNTDPVQARQAEREATVRAEHVLPNPEWHTGGFVAVCECGKRLGWYRSRAEVDKAHEAHVWAVIEDTGDEYAGFYERSMAGVDQRADELGGAS